MDIYKFINSRDVAHHCRKIKKIWNPFEMAVIIGRSFCAMNERLAAWEEIITDYSDMPTPVNESYDSFPSLHKALTDLIAIEKIALKQFKLVEDGAKYSYDAIIHESIQPDSCFATLESCVDAIQHNWKRDEIAALIVTKDLPGDDGRMSYLINYDGELLYPTFLLDDVAWLFDDYDLDEILYLSDYMNKPIYIDIPTPFKPGDIVGARYPQQIGIFDYELYGVLEEMATDYIGGLVYLVDKKGKISKSLVESDCLEYYRSMLNKKDRTLRYLSAYLASRNRMSPELVKFYERHPRR